MDNDDFYSGLGGKRYLGQRGGAISGHNQSLRASLFSDLGAPGLTVLDFGCGTGAVVQRMEAALRYGVEVSEAAAVIAEAAGVKVIRKLEFLPDRSVDVVISFHALEHVDDPLAILRQIRRVLKPEGRTRLVVPCELPVLRAQRSWRPNNDRHLYTWTPLLFGNLAHRAGLEVIDCRVAPMPTGSRLIRALRWAPQIAALVHIAMALKRNALNVILEARSS
jgi:SAM-dependent methyltransferase